MKKFSDELFFYIKKQFPKLNLVGYKNEQAFYEENFLELECFLKNQEIHLKEYLVDMGCGGGFPLIPLKKNFPNHQVLGIDSKRKKVLAVKNIIQHFNLDIKVEAFRFEEILFDRSCSLFFKAVGPIEETLSLLNIEKPCDIYFFKGPKEKSLRPFYLYDFMDHQRYVYFLKDYQSPQLKSFFENKELVKISTLF